MKIGDLVICHCSGKTWYRGLVGMITGFIRNGVPREEGDGGEALVLYGNSQTVELIADRLEVIS